MWVSINPLERLMARRYQVDTVESICRFFRNARGLHLRSTCRKFVYHARQNHHDRFSFHPRRSSTFTRSDTVTRAKSFFATLRTRICKKSQHDRSCLLFRCQISRMGVQRANLTRRRRIARSTNAACAWCVSYILISQPNGTFIQNCPRETINVYRERERERRNEIKGLVARSIEGSKRLKASRTSLSHRAKPPSVFSRLMRATIINPLKEKKKRGKNGATVELPTHALHAFLPRSVEKARESFQPVVDESGRYARTFVHYSLEEMSHCRWQRSNSACLKNREAARRQPLKNASPTLSLFTPRCKPVRGRINRENVLTVVVLSFASQRYN